MIIRADSLALRILLVFANPTMRLPSLFPLWITHARVGDNMTDYVRVTFRRPKPQYPFANRIPD